MVWFARPVQTIFSDGELSWHGKFRHMVADTCTRLSDDQKTAPTPSFSPHHNKKILFFKLRNIIEKKLEKRTCGKI